MVISGIKEGGTELKIAIDIDNTLCTTTEAVLEYINENIGTKNFGNARFVRNMYEKTVVKHATNTKDKKRTDLLTTISKDDVNIDNLIKE